MEGLRGEKIRREYGGATNLATASIETSKSAAGYKNKKGKVGTGPKDLCNLKEHHGHTSQQKLCNGDITINQRLYIEKLLKRFEIPGNARLV